MNGWLAAFLGRVPAERASARLRPRVPLGDDARRDGGVDHAAQGDAGALPRDLRALVAVAAALAPASAERLVARCELRDDLARAVRDEARALAGRPRDARIGALLRAVGSTPEPARHVPPLVERLRRELAPLHSFDRPHETLVRRTAPPSAAEPAARASGSGPRASAHGHGPWAAAPTLVRARHGA